jgi:uncharacterized protein YqjF (DUF2071 family)
MEIRKGQSKVFLTAEWQKLLMINYPLDAALLQPWLPYGTEPDLFEGCCLVSMVGFLFLNTRLKGIPVPFHQKFEEVNLRFYVRRKENGIWRRGTVFIKEIVPKPAISLVARLLYGEPYATCKMEHQWQASDNEIQVDYRWKTGKWNSISIRSENHLQEVPPGTETEFIMEHYWGYTRHDDKTTSEYAVEHPRWKVYPTISYEGQIDFAKNYGEAFSVLEHTKASSAFLLEGSEVLVREGRRLN